MMDIANHMVCLTEHGLVCTDDGELPRRYVFQWVICSVKTLRKLLGAFCWVVGQKQIQPNLWKLLLGLFHGCGCQTVKGSTIANIETSNSV